MSVEGKKINFEEAKIIPGMIEKIERLMLFETVKSLTLQEGDSIVEFGPFFGRSTNCIAQGLLANPSYKKDNKFFTYDSFECNEKGWFAPHLIGAADLGNVSSLLKTSEETINFEEVFNHFLKPYLDSGTVSSIKSELIHSTPPPGRISYIHIDSPKYYEELKIILIRFLPQMRVDGLIIFQDFFYQWSATLIITVAILIEKSFISIQASAASSLVCKVLKVPNSKDIKELDLLMQDEKECEKLFDYAIESCQKIKLDRSESFLPKLVLAKIQWQYARKDYKNARRTIVNYLKEGNPFQLRLVDTFLELFAYGFSIRELFEKDYQKDDSGSSLTGSGGFERVD
jgi:hypothetical protein